MFSYSQAQTHSIVYKPTVAELGELENVSMEVEPEKPRPKTPEPTPRSSSPPPQLQTAQFRKNRSPERPTRTRRARSPTRLA